MKIKFPAANVSVKDWDKNEDYLAYVLFDPYIYTPKEATFRRYWAGQSFVDSSGTVFKATGRIMPPRVRQVLSFLPNFCRVELVFEPTGQIMSMEEVRSHMLRQLEKLDNYGNKAGWIENVKRAATIEDIISGD
ncbi:MAG: hypothetical protein LBU98_03580 [Alistipes sp.]|nr:hypothetical protein [Alistipes sp.]